MKITVITDKMKPQELRFQVPAGFARVAANAVWHHLLTHYDMRATTRVEGFPSDDEQMLIIQLFCRDREMRSIEADITANFELSTD